MPRWTNPHPNVEVSAREAKLLFRANVRNDGASSDNKLYEIDQYGGGKKGVKFLAGEKY